MEATRGQLIRNISQDETARIRRPGLGIADRSEGPAVIAAVVVASGREVRDSIVVDLVDGQCHDAVGEERLL